MCVPNASAFLRAQSEHGCVQLRIWLLEAIGCLWICCLKRWVQFVDGTAFSPKMTLMLVCVFSSNVAPSFSTRRVCSGLGVFMGIHTRNIIRSLVQQERIQSCALGLQGQKWQHTNTQPNFPCVRSGSRLALWPSRTPITVSGPWNRKFKSRCVQIVA